MKTLLTTTAILICFSICATSQAVSFSHLYVAGDSFSDTGRGVQLGHLLSTDYWNQSEPSNGPLWPDQLMSLFGKAYLQGDNQAVGGSTTYTTPNHPGLLDQINSFQILDAPRSVFVIWLGHNDLRFVPIEAVDQAADDALANVKQGIALLRRKGALRILVLGLCDVAVAPFDERTPDQIAAFTEAEQRFNSALQQYAREQTLRSAGRIIIRYVDTFGFLDDVRSGLPHPDGIGLNDPQWICCRDWSAGNQYGYWDGLHFTTYEYGQLAQKLKAIIARMK